MRGGERGREGGREGGREEGGREGGERVRNIQELLPPTCALTRYQTLDLSGYGKTLQPSHRAGVFYTLLLVYPQSCYDTLI